VHEHPIPRLTVHRTESGGVAEHGPENRPEAAAPGASDADEVFQITHRRSRDQAFDELYRREHLAMLRLGYLLTSDRDAAAEVTHDAFIRTYQQWDRLDRPGAYLRRSVVNGCNDHHRRRIRRATTSVAEVSDVADRATVGAPDPDDQLAAAIAGLRPKRRAAIVLRYYLDLPQAEIAAALGVRQGTVKSLLHRGLADLRAVLDDLPEGSASTRLRSTGAASPRSAGASPRLASPPTASPPAASSRASTSRPTSPDHAAEDPR
jgi:RNA polymerase sigma-70 factor (sigma-E family)